MKNITNLFNDTEKKFGLENACFLFEYVSQTIPRKQYHTLQGVYAHMKREIDGFYNVRNEIRKEKRYLSRG